MSFIRANVRFKLFAFLTSSVTSLLPSVVAADEATVASDWFERLSRAFSEQNYDGVFVYAHGDGMDTLRIVHRADGNTERERIVRLDGPKLELIRHGEELTCVHSSEWKGDIKHRIPSGPFAKAFVRDISKLNENYQIKMVKDDRIVGREAVSLQIVPNDDHRYGYRVWLDKETGLLLKSVLVHKGTVLERFQFTQLSVGKNVSDQALEMGIEGDVMVHYPLRTRTNDHIEEKMPAWRLVWKPPGFVMKVRGIRREVGAKMNADTLTFTDGMSAFSVFVERVPVDGHHDAATQVGATVAVARLIRKNSNNHFVTVVGEVPMKTAKRLAASVVPVAGNHSP